VFTRSGSAWSQQGPKLTPNGETGRGAFGTKVAVSADGDTLLVGAALDNTSTGAAWVFVRSGSSWSQQGAKLVVAKSVVLGETVALSADGDIALLTMGSAQGPSSVVVFSRTGSTWSQGPELTSVSHGGPTSSFGQYLALSSDANTALIGEPCYGRGAAWIFTRSGTTWTRRREFVLGTKADCSFGGPVALSGDGDTALVADGGGSVWVFTHRNQGNVWTQQASAVRPSATGYNDASSVASSGDGTTVLIGDGDFAQQDGAVWSFGRTGAPCNYSQQVQSTNGLLGDWRLGESSGTTAVDTTGQHNGTYTGGFTLRAPGAILGDTNTAVTLNGSTGKVALPSLASASNWTVQAWTDLDPSTSSNPNGNNALYASPTGVRLIIRPTGIYYDDLSTGHAQGAKSIATDPNTGRWVYWTLVRNGSTLTLYRNGEQIATSSLGSEGLTHLNGGLGSQGSAYPLHGSVDEVAVSSSALSASTIQSQYICSGWG
jgi:hypothetical protein